LKGSKKLQAVSFTFQDEEAVRALANGLEKNKSLNSFDLSWTICKKTDGGYESRSVSICVSNGDVTANVFESDEKDPLVVCIRELAQKVAKHK